MGKPVLIVVNGLPGTGKTTLANRLASDIPLPAFARDGLYEVVYDTLHCQSNGSPPLIAATGYALLYYVAGKLLAAGQSLIVEAFFGNTELRSAELLELQRASDFEPLQILCQADGEVLLERFLARMESGERPLGHRDQEWIEQHKATLLKGRLPPLTLGGLGGQLIEIDTTTPDSFDYAALLERVRSIIAQK